MYINRNSRKIVLFACTSGFEFYEIQDQVYLLKTPHGFSPGMLINKTSEGFFGTILSTSYEPPKTSVRDKQYQVNHQNYRMDGCKKLVQVPADNRFKISNSFTFSSDITLLYDNDFISNTRCEKVFGQCQGVEVVDSEFQPTSNNCVLRFYYYEPAGAPRTIASMDNKEAKRPTLNTRFFNASKVGSCIEAGTSANITDQETESVVWSSITEESVYFQNFKYVTAITGCVFIGLDNGSTSQRIIEIFKIMYP